MPDQKTTQAVVVNQSSIKDHQKTERFALFDADGDPIALSDTNVLSTVLTGYAIGEGTETALTASDTVLSAIATLEKRVADLEGA